MLRARIGAVGAAGGMTSCPSCKAVHPVGQSYCATCAAPVAVVDLPDEEAALAPGTTLGSYEVVDVLGEGGMVFVFKARDTKLNRIVALKLIRQEMRDNHPDADRRFRREAEAAAQLMHPNVAVLYDADGTLVKTIAMEKEIFTCNNGGVPVTRDQETFVEIIEQEVAGPRLVTLPARVQSVVIRIGRRRRVPAWSSASCQLLPAA